MSLGHSGTGKRSFGKMETWEPEDKSFTKHTLSDGIGDCTPNDGAMCMVSISFIDAVGIPEEEFGSYVLNDLFEVTIGEGDTHLSEIFDKVICSMKENETAYIKSKVDEKGNKVEDLLLKEKALKFNVVLKAFNRAAEIDELENDEKIEKAQHHKDKGTELFKANKLDFAEKRYFKAAKFLENMQGIEDLPESLRNQSSTLQVQCYNNLGACYLKQERHDDVIDITSKALVVEDTNVKALFRRGQSYGKLHKYAEAKHDYEKGLMLEPDNNAIKNQLKNIEGLMKKEKDVYTKMFK